MTVKISSLFAPDNSANNPSTVEKPPNITSAFPTVNLQSVNRLTERIASSKDISNLPGGSKNYAASPLDQNNPARQTDAPTEIVQTFKTNGGSWRTRNNVENDTPRFYRDGEDTSGTTRFDKEFYTDKNTNQWVRLNANGRAADAPEFKGKQKPEDVSDFDWKGWNEVAADDVPGEYTTEGKTISFTDAANADNANTVLRRYIQQNVIGDGWTGDVGTDEQAVARAAGLGVKVQAEPIGKDADGKTVFRVAISDEDLAKLRQVKAEWTTQKAEQAQKNAAARNETNQKFLDLPRVLWNSTVNVAQGTVNTVLDAAQINGGQNPLALLDPTRPQVDFSGAKTDYRSEMMRRNLHGKVDGEGIKAGETIEAGVTLVAPIVVGAATAPKAAPQSLKTLGGIPEAESVTGLTSVVKPDKSLGASGVIEVGGKTQKQIRYTSKEMLRNYAGEETGSVWGTKVKYLTKAERADLELFVKNGKIVDRQGNLYDTSSSSSVFGAGQGKSIFVMDEYGRIYASKYQAVGKFHHSSMLEGKPVASAGEITVKNGKITEISNRSGHYQPTQQMNTQVINELKSRGVVTSNIKITGF